MAILLRSRTVVLSLHTVTRAAAEAAAQGSYVAEPGIDERERIRRILNIRLAGMNQERLSLQRFTTPGAAAQVAAVEQSIARFERSAPGHGFAFFPAKGSKAAYLDTALPSTTALLGMFVFPGQELLGKSYYSGLSSVAHSQLNGLMRKLGPGTTGAQVNTTAKDAALELFAGPLCVSTLVENMLPYLGWDAEAVNASIPAMFEIWGEIAQTPYPGADPPEAGADG